MKEKYRPVYLALLILGVILLGAALLLRNSGIPVSAHGAMLGVGGGLTAMAAAYLLMLHWVKRDPRKMKMEEIEAKDERSVAIRRRAQAVAGNALQWGMIAAAWLSIGLGAPLWVMLTMVAAFVAKTVLELCLMARYQREM